MRLGGNAPSTLRPPGSIMLSWWNEMVVNEQLDSAMSPNQQPTVTYLINNHLLCIALRSNQECVPTCPGSRATANSILLSLRVTSP